MELLVGEGFWPEEPRAVVSRAVQVETHQLAIFDQRVRSLVVQLTMVSYAGVLVFCRSGS
jgi:hypothetical protein